MQKTVTIDFTEGEGADKVDLKGIVVLRSLNFKELNSVKKEATTITMLGKMPKVEINPWTMAEYGILKGLVSANLVRTARTYDRAKDQILESPAPYALDMNGIYNLPASVGEQLSEAFTELNEVTDKKKET